MDCECNRRRTDRGVEACVIDVAQSAVQNQNFRTAMWTGCHMQMTLMCIPVCGEIGLEVHTDTDQLIRVEQGRCVVRMGTCERQQEFQREIGEGFTIFVPAGIWHNVINTGHSPLKVSAIYTPPHHPAGTIHRRKEDAEREEMR